MEQICAFSGVASVCLGATPALFQATPPSTGEDIFTFALATDNKEAEHETSLGLQSLLFNDVSETKHHFEAALAADPTTPLPSIGLALISTDASERTALLNTLRQNFQNIAATPAEAFYLSVFLKMTEGKIAEATREWTARADQFPRDLYSVSWAILLQHYSNTPKDAEGISTQEHSEAFRRAESFYAKYGKMNPAACYLRALIEESLPEISQEALEASAAFCDAKPDNAIALHLHAHLLYRSEHPEEAANFFHRAYLAAKNGDNEISSLRARLYESVALWSCRKNREALSIRRELNALPYNPTANGAHDIFMTWESHTLPLRILIQRETLPHPSDINAALKAAIPSDKNCQAPALAAHCIAYSLYARLAHSAGKKEQAILSLKKAEAFLKNYEKLQSECTEKSLLLITPYKRLHTACIIAINKARGEIYPSSDDMWKDNIRFSTLHTYSDFTLPPIVPERH